MPPTPEELSALLPQYRIESLLGQGGMGAVYKGVQVALKRPVAIKLLPLEISADPAFAKRFEHEAQTLAKLSHPNIVAVHDFGTTSEGHLYFVMEFVEGTDLHKMIHGPGLNPAQTFSIIIAVCEALQYAHGKGVVHRDIKPANVLVNTEGTVKVADFGLARLNTPDSESGGLTMTGSVMGTPAYMAPEQTRGMNVDHRADIYSLGVMLYEMLCGEIPRGVFDPPSRKVRVDIRLDEVVLKAMNSEPERRYQNTVEMKTDVDRIRTTPGKMGRGKKPETGERKPENKTPRTRIAAVVALCLALAGTGGFFIWKKAHDPGKADGVSPVSSSSVVPATKDAPFVNTLGMEFVPVPGTQVLFCRWETRVKDYTAYARVSKGVDAAWAAANKDGVPSSREPEHPVASVSWNDAKGFCEWLTKKEQAEGKLAKGIAYRLPTDEEWSRAVGLQFESGATPAARSQKNSVDSPGGTGFPPTGKAGNYADEAYHAKFPNKKAGEEDDPEVEKDPKAKNWIVAYTDGFATSAPAGSFLPNELGIYDLGGNVWEWCEDWYDATQKARVLRGASWCGSDRLDLLSSRRLSSPPTRRSHDLGFRVVVGGASAPEVAPGVATTPPSPSVTPTAPPPFTKPGNEIAAATKDAPFVNTLGMRFVPVPGTKVRFSIWNTRVQDYAAYAKAQEGAGKPVDGSWKNRVFKGLPVGREPDHPVVGVNWEDAQSFCRWLTDKETAEGKLAKGQSYRLPTDVEWSIAVGLPLEKGATPEERNIVSQQSSIYPWGSEWPPPKGAGNFAGKEVASAIAAGRLDGHNNVIAGYEDGFVGTSPVGSFAANRFGLYDMAGNVWQWCDDWFNKEQKGRVIRGGSFDASARIHLFSFDRSLSPPLTRPPSHGFRCVIELASSSAQAPSASSTPVLASQTTSAAASTLTGPVNLLGSLDLARDVKSGKWTMTPGGLQMEPMPGKTAHEMLSFNIDAPEEYDYEIEFTLVRGNRDNLRGVFQSMPIAGKSKLWKMGGNEPQWMFLFGPSLDGKDPEQTPDRTEAMALYNPLKSGQRYRSLVQVRRQSVRALLDDAELVNWSGDLQRLVNLDANFKFGTFTKPGLGAYGVTAIFHKAELRPPGSEIRVSPPPTSATKDAPFVNTLGMKFVPVPIGGGPTAGQRVLFGVWDVRVQDYAAYAKAQEGAGKKVDGSWDTQTKDGVPVGRELDHPVVGVSWEDAQAFCRWLTEKETAEGKLPKGMRYRLPGDEEWSWAVGLPPESGGMRDEKKMRLRGFPWGADYPPTKKVANVADETFHAKFPKDKDKDLPWIKDYDDGYATTSPVGSFPANAYGLYDMGGNVFQWCEDWFDKAQEDRVLRGASWQNFDPGTLWSSARYRGKPGVRNSTRGFLCVLGESAP